MPKANGADERRRVGRAKLTTFYPAAFAHGGRKIRALMRDVSEFGAGFRVDEDAGGLSLEPDQLLALEIKTPYGPSTRRGAVRWARVVDEFYYFGVEFAERVDDEDDPLHVQQGVDDEDDPLHALLDSPF